MTAHDHYTCVLAASLRPNPARDEAIWEAAWVARASGKPCRAVTATDGYSIAPEGTWFDGETVAVCRP